MTEGAEVNAVPKASMAGIGKAAEGWQQSLIIYSDSDTRSGLERVSLFWRGIVGD